VLFDQWTEAFLFRTLATLRLEVPVFDSIDELEWKAPTPEFERYCERIQAPALYTRAAAVAHANAARAARA
jgi:hypothetical protein